MSVPSDIPRHENAKVDPASQFITKRNNKGEVKVSATVKMKIGNAERDILITRTFSDEAYSKASHQGIITELMEETKSRMTALGQIYRLGEKAKEIVLENDSLIRTSTQGKEKRQDLGTALQEKLAKLHSQAQKIHQINNNDPKLPNLIGRIQSFSGLAGYLQPKPKDQKVPDQGHDAFKSEGQGQIPVGQQKEDSQPTKEEKEKGADQPDDTQPIHRPTRRRAQTEGDSKSDEVD